MEEWFCGKALISSINTWWVVFHEFQLQHGFINGYKGYIAIFILNELLLTSKNRLEIVSKLKTRRMEYTKRLIDFLVEDQLWRLKTYCVNCITMSDKLTSLKKWKCVSQLIKEDWNLAVKLGIIEIFFKVYSPHQINSEIL